MPSDEPRQPPPGAWNFISELQAPLWNRHAWSPQSPPAGALDLSGGVTLLHEIPDPKNLLAAATMDFRAFLAAGNIPGDGPYRIRLARGDDSVREAFQIEVRKADCSIVAGDVEGIRRGLFLLEEWMLAAGGPFLPLGVTARKPWVRTRIARNFYSPIKRPPFNRDELADEEDYYPDAYLNRLAHEGINGLWLSVELRDLCRSRFFPAFGRDAAKRLAKLRHAVERCARHGIRLFAFMIEPVSFGPSADQIPLEQGERHPELLGCGEGSKRFFCTGGEAGQACLEEMVADLFQQVPGLGGIINISFGERPTHCYSGASLLAGNLCPRCSKKGPSTVMAETVAAMARGMHAMAPDAEMISWLYVPQIRETPGMDPDRIRETLRQIAAHTPPTVTLQVNFESMADELQLGAEREVLDYSLAHVGPSAFFSACAQAARQGGANMSAKLQVGCSHEVATVPFVPVPGNIYRKYARMRELGVSSAMQCWYFGNYPSVMNRAAGRCSFEPFPESEEAFLFELAAPDWGGAASTVVEAWKRFRDAYAEFPANLLFAHYSPVHDCLCWPLHLQPVDLPIAPSWLLGHTPSGDRVGECIGYFHTWDEALLLIERVADGWQSGLELLLSLAQPGLDAVRLREIGVAEALGLQFRSAANVLRFYWLREELPWQEPGVRQQTLESMRALVGDEIRLGERMVQLADADSSLGFHSEAEGYKYFPEKLRWRVRQLRQLLATEFEQVGKQIAGGVDIFAAHCGKQPQGPFWHCIHTDARSSDSVPWHEVPIETSACREDAGTRMAWQAAHNDRCLFFRIRCQSDQSTSRPDTFSWGDNMDSERVLVWIEPRRLWPPVRIHVDREGRVFHDDSCSRMDHRTRALVEPCDKGWVAEIEIPLDALRASGSVERPMRVNIQYHCRPDLPPVEWIGSSPAKSRLHFGTHNPKNLGWLLFVSQSMECTHGQ